MNHGFPLTDIAKLEMLVTETHFKTEKQKKNPHRSALSSVVFLPK